MADAEVGACQIGQHEADVVHLGDGNEKIGQCRGGHNTEISIADGHGHRVLQVGWELVEEQNERVATKELLPGLWPRCVQQRRNVAGKLISLAQLVSY